MLGFFHMMVLVPPVVLSFHLNSDKDLTAIQKRFLPNFFSQLNNKYGKKDTKSNKTSKKDDKPNKLKTNREKITKPRNQKKKDPNKGNGKGRKENPAVESLQEPDVEEWDEIVTETTTTSAPTITTVSSTTMAVTTAAESTVVQSSSSTTKYTITVAPTRNQEPPTKTNEPTTDEEIVTEIAPTTDSEPLDQSSPDKDSASDIPLVESILPDEPLPDTDINSTTDERKNGRHYYGYGDMNYLDNSGAFSNQAIGFISVFIFALAL